MKYKQTYLKGLWKLIIPILVVSFLGFDHVSLQKYNSEVMASEPEPTPTVTVTPTLTPTPEPTVEKAIKEVFGDEADLMIAIAKAESGLDPNKVHSDEVEHSVGLFQIHLRTDHGQGKKIHWEKVPGNTLEEKTEWLKDPYNNALTARFIKATSGLRAWSVYTNETYKKFLK